MSYERRPLLPAVVSPRAARLLVQGAGEHLVAIEEFATQLLIYKPAPETAGAARDVLVAVAQVRESGRQWSAAQGDEPPVAARGNAAMPIEAEASESAASPRTVRWSVAEAAERLDLRARQVRNLCGEEGRLSAVLVGGRWQIDPVSVEAEAHRRAVRAEARRAG